MNINTTATSFSGGVDAIMGNGKTSSVTFSGIWAEGDEYTVIATDSETGLQTQIGAGYVTSISPTFVFTYDDKVYALAGSTMFCSAIGSASTFNDPNASGDGFIDMSTSFNIATTVSAIAAYQGRLAFFSRYNIQIWNVDADISNWSLSQALANIGTVAKNSVQSLGELDVLFLADTGVRSLRVRDSSLNAFITDMGSPIDLLIQASLQANPATNAQACAIVEPATGRYWLYLNGLIYVLSYYPSNKIIAWSTYEPTSVINGALTTFVPVKFDLYNGQVFALGQDGNIYQYGGIDGKTYDACHMKVQLPFLSANAPGTRKTVRAVDLVANTELCQPDSIKFYVSADQKSAQDPTTGDPATLMWSLLLTTTVSTFDDGIIPYSDQGTHFSVYLESQGDGNGGAGGPASFSEALFHYDANEEKG